MSQTALIMLPMSWDLNSLAECIQRCKGDGQMDIGLSTAPTGKLQLNVQRKGGPYMIASEIVDRVGAAGDYEDEAFPDELRRQFADLRIFFVMFNDFELARSAFRCIALGVTRAGGVGWIDTDYGWVIRARDLIARLDEDPGWDWRTAPPDDAL